MALSPYQFRPVTPPVAEDVPGLIPGSHSRTVSARSSPEYPDSYECNPATPLDRSPAFQYGGPVLIPQVRKQDLSPDTHLSLSSSRGHRRASSASVNLYAPQQQEHHLGVRPGANRATTSPPELFDYEAPSTASTNFSVGSAADFLLGPPGNFVPQFQSKHYGHSRSISESVINNASFNSFGYQPQHRSSYMSNVYVPPTITQESFNFSSCPAESVFSEPCFDISSSEMFSMPELNEPIIDEPTTSQMEYLCSPTPVVQVCRQQPLPLGRNRKAQYWFDIRNLAEWSDFSLPTVMSFPGFADLLTVPVATSRLPDPLVLPSRTRPADPAELKQLVRDFYLTKVNAALRASQLSDKYIQMRPAQAHHGGADFIANYEVPATQTISGDGTKGRVVGLVKSFETWNSGMRRSLSPLEQIKYLDGLAHLHRCMRESECRYGFIMTETELVCARYGTEEGNPFFGYIELSTSIRLNETQGLTACLALWYLHMLARDAVLPGQCGYKVHVGYPGEMSRRKVLEKKDDWIAKLRVTEGDRREARASRGWADPTEKWNRKMEGGGARRRK